MTATTEMFTIRLPLAAARRLRHVAEISQRPIDEVVAETLRVTLPPGLEDVPPAFRAALVQLETRSTADLWQEMQATLPAPQVARYDALLRQHATSTLDSAGEKELAHLRAEADQLMFRKAYAALLLKWRGERIPSLTGLDSEP